MYLGALALDPFSIANTALTMLTRASGGPQAPVLGQPEGGIRVSTAVQTTVSPQISPNFIQQQSPQNSPVNAATLQYSPAPQSADMSVPNAASAPSNGIPITGALPGIDTASGYLPVGTPLAPPPAQAAGIGGGTLLAAGGIILAAFLLRRSGGAVRGGRRAGRRKKGA